jgi:predicted SnoaL-like aldol condensation-catalyzing enzyme
MTQISALVAEGVLELTGGPDTAAAAGRYYSREFIQHSPVFPGGWDGLQASIEQAKQQGATYELLRSFGEGDLAVLHARVIGFAPVPLILINLYRVVDGKIAEHWEAMQPEATETVSGNGMVDGPTEPADLDRTDENRELVRRLIENVFVGGDAQAVGEYFDGDALIQHNPLIPDGVSGLAKALDELAQEGRTVEYTKLHRIVAEGNFVFTQSEGKLGGVPHSFYEVFRVAGGKVAEHWDVACEVPAQLPHDNGVF